MYSARITRLNPTAFIILIDQSGSMTSKINFNSTLMTKADVVALVTNMMISELTYRCQREIGVANYFDIAALGYSGDEVIPLLDPQKSFLKPSELLAMERPKLKYSKERTLPDGSTVMVNSEQICWIRPKAEGSTPMCAALLKAYSLASTWCSTKANHESYPITIFNITDGEASDGNPNELMAVANDIKGLRTCDGNVLLINIHICANEYETKKNIIFPCSKDELPQIRYAHLLYDMSSEMPKEYNQTICEVRSAAATPPYRGMSFNTSATEIISMMNIGSMSVNVI